MILINFLSKIKFLVVKNYIEYLMLKPSNPNTFIYATPDWRNHPDELDALIKL